MTKFSKKPEPSFDRHNALVELPGYKTRRFRPSAPAAVQTVSRNQDPRLELDAILNHEGGLAFGRDDRTTLLNMAACCLVNEQCFYGDPMPKVRLLLHRVLHAHPEWSVKLAVFLREHLHLRSISQLILACAAMVPEARPFVERAFERVTQRPDDLLETAALLKDPRHGLANSLPSVARRSLARSLNRLSDYHAVKYRKGDGFGLRHLVRLCHPKPGSERQSLLFRYILDRTAWQRFSRSERESLPVIEVWEALRSGDPSDPVLLDQCVEAGLPWEIIVPRFGSTREVWSRLAPCLPIMALLRNLRNLHKTGCLELNEVRSAVRRRLTDPETVRNSRQLPFRWLSAYRVMEPLDKEVAKWLETAMELSIANLPRLPGKTVIACDNSGSMSCLGISRNSMICPIDISSMLGAVADRICEDNLLFVFGSTINHLQFKREGKLLERARLIAETDVGWATNAYKVLKVLLSIRTPVDRILFFTDMQIYGESEGWSHDEDITCLLREYRRQVTPGVKTYIFNLQPYEHFMTPRDENGVTYFSGWNANLLQYAALDSDPAGRSMVSLVDSVEL